MPSAAGWRIDREGAPPLEADAVIVATGGLSVPNTGSDGLGLKVVERLGHTVHPTYGEMLDAFGPIGGYSFLWAWATGRAAALSAARAPGRQDRVAVQGAR